MRRRIREGRGMLTGGRTGGGACPGCGEHLSNRLGVCPNPACGAPRVTRQQRREEADAMEG